MGLVISKGLTLRKGYRQPMTLMQAYIAAVEQLMARLLSIQVARIDDFVRGCKADGIWNAIKASCILAGARTRNLVH
jgi:hypothetical protein